MYPGTLRWDNPLSADLGSEQGPVDQQWLRNSQGPMDQQWLRNWHAASKEQKEAAFLQTTAFLEAHHRDSLQQDTARAPVEPQYSIQPQPMISELHGPSDQEWMRNWQATDKEQKEATFLQTIAFLDARHRDSLQNPRSTENNTPPSRYATERTYKSAPSRSVSLTEERLAYLNQHPYAPHLQLPQGSPPPPYSSYGLTNPPTNQQINISQQLHQPLYQTASFEPRANSTPHIPKRRNTHQDPTNLGYPAESSFNHQPQIPFLVPTPNSINQPQTSQTIGQQPISAQTSTASTSSTPLTANQQTNNLPPPIPNLPPPTSRDEVRAFLGMANYYRELNPEYETISAPLVALATGVDEFSWTRHHQLAFELLKVPIDVTTQYRSQQPQQLQYPDNTGNNHQPNTTSGNNQPNYFQPLHIHQPHQLNITSSNPWSSLERMAQGGNAANVSYQSQNPSQRSPTQLPTSPAAYPNPGPMRSVPHTAFNKYSGEMTCCFEEPTDGSQGLVDWTAAFRNAYCISNIEERRWPEFIQGHLSGAALQEAKTIRRENPQITWKGIVDHFTAKFAVVDEQFQLRAKIAALRPSQFNSLAKFVARFTHLTSYVDKSQCPPQLLADTLVTSLVGSPAAPYITTMHLQAGGRPTLGSLLSALTVLSQSWHTSTASTSSTTSTPTPLPPTPPTTNHNVLLAGFASQPAPPTVYPSPTRRPPATEPPPTRPCRFCREAHWDRDCKLNPQHAQSPASPLRTPLSIRQPRRPCRVCEGAHWDVDCPNVSAKKPRPGVSPAPTNTSSRQLIPYNNNNNRSSDPTTQLKLASFAYNSGEEAEYRPEPIDYQYLYESDHRNDTEDTQFGDTATSDPNDNLPPQDAGFNACPFKLDGNNIRQDAEPYACALGELPSPTPSDVEPPFQEELLVEASVNGRACQDALIDSGCQITAISMKVARTLQLAIAPCNITIGVADSRRIKVSGTAVVVIRVANAQPIEMPVLVFDGLLYSMLLGLDYLAATNANIQPGQTPFLTFPDGASDVPRIILRSRISSRLEFNAAAFRPMSEPGEVIFRSSNLHEQDPPEVEGLLPEDLRLGKPHAQPKAPVQPVTGMPQQEFLRRIMSQVKVVDSAQRAAIQEILAEFQPAFATHLSDISTPADVPEFYINSISDDPQLVGPRYKKKYSDDDRTTIEAQTQLWWDNGIVEPCLHPNPILNNLTCVPKSDGTRRVCIDATGINKATYFDATFTPDMREILERMAGSKFISVFDLYSGYLQIPFRPEDRHKLAFATRLGVFQPTRMFFGSKTACAFFCLRILRIEIDNDLSAFLAPYFDDLSVHSLSFEDHLVHLRKFLAAIVKYRLKINLPKSIIGAEEVKALGVMVSAKGIKPVPEDIDAIVRMPQPTTRSEVRTLLGMTGFYRLFIPDYATISAPLAALTAGSGKISWMETHEQAFAVLKTALCSQPLLALPIVSNNFKIYADACNIGIGGVVTQIQPDGVEKPVAFFSRQLTPAERNYSVTEQELLAIVFMVAKARHWITGKPTTAVTDHEALQFLLASHDLKPRLVRWKLALNQFDLTIVFRKGALQLEGADLLSRLPFPPLLIAATVPPQKIAVAALLSSFRPGEVVDSNIFATSPNREVRALAFQLSTPPVLAYHFRDPFLNPPLLALIQSGTTTAISATLLRKLKLVASNYKWESSLLFFKRQSDIAWLWVPIVAQRTTFVARAHLLGHFGLISTLLRLQQQFKVWWPSISEDTAAFIATCAACITRLPTPPVHHPAIALPIPGTFHRVAMDLTLGLPITKRGNIGVLVIMEYLTKFPVLYAIKSKTAEEVAGCFLNFVAFVGPPHEVLSDQGGEFVNAVLKSMCSNLGIEKRVTSSYSPATNGMVERFNRTLIRALETHAANHPEDWDLSLDYVAFAYRTNVHAAHGKTPFEMMFGRPANSFTTPRPVLMADSCVAESLLQRADEIKQLVEGTIPATVEILQAYQERQVATQDKAAKVMVEPLSVGAVVYCKNNLHQKKMQARFLGPYRVAEITSQGLYKLVNRHGAILKKTFPLDQLKVIDPLHAEKIWTAELSQVFTVTAIIDHRFESSRRGIEYLVSWEGYDHEHDSWVRATDILDHDLIAAYEATPLATATSEEPPPANSL